MGFSFELRGRAPGGIAGPGGLRNVPLVGEERSGTNIGRTQMTNSSATVAGYFRPSSERTTLSTFSTVGSDAFPIRRSKRWVETVRTCSATT